MRKRGVIDLNNFILMDVMDKNNFDAGTKARNDVATILNHMGFKPIIIFNRTHNNFQRTLEVLKAVSNLKKNIVKNDLIVLQYPYHITIMKLLLKNINYLRQRFKCKFILLIHDVVYLRNESYVKKSISEMMKLEVSFFNNADAVIVHNKKMQKRLLRDGVQSPMFPLGVFDYLYEGKSAVVPYTDFVNVVFAGNLSIQKSGFIYNYESCSDVIFNLYGMEEPMELTSSFNYQGSFPPDELIANMVGDYGLVWDGSSANTCEGNYGNYLRFNNPHKFSLYIAAEMPVVVWAQSALASFVKENNIGFCINSLKELEELPSSKTQEYESIRKNVVCIANKIKKGYYLKNVMEIILKNKECLEKFKNQGEDLG